MKGLVLTYLITFGGALAALRYPLIGLQVFVGLVVLRPQYLFGFAGNLANLSKIVGVAVLIGWAVNGFGTWRFGRGRYVVVILVLFGSWFMLSAAFALERTPAFREIPAQIKLILPMLVGVTMIKSEADCRPILWAMVLAQGWVSLEMHIEYLIKGINGASRGFGGYDNNFFGASLVTMVGPALALMIASKKWWTRGLAAVIAAMTVHTTLLTFSRGAMLGLVAVGLTAFVMMPKRPKYVGALLLTLVVTSRFIGPELYTRYVSTFASTGQRDQSAQSRVDLWRDCLTVVADYPIFGVGPANWRVVSERYGWPPGKSAHSVWMEAAAEIGIPGASALLLFFVLPALLLWPIARAPVTDENLNEVILASGVILAAVGYVVSGQFVSAQGLETPYFVVMLGIGLLKVTTRHEMVPEAAMRLRVVPDRAPLRRLPVTQRSTGKTLPNRPS